ncbi:MAG: hypothetical protein LPK02_07085 [Rhodobacterales bacterium]|nr:hypothetical protein [Rhodobacterales bacterium]
MKESPYSEGRLQDWDLGSLRTLRERVDLEIQRRLTMELHGLEAREDELRAELGLPKLKRPKR